MKWKKAPKPRYGDTRTKTRFLFYPKCIQLKCRWLEKATWLEECKRSEILPNGIWVVVWEPKRWEDWD